MAVNEGEMAKRCEKKNNKKQLKQQIRHTLTETK